MIDKTFTHKMLDQQTINIQNDLLRFAPRVFESQPVLFSYLYGSYATGSVHTFSDLDIGVYVEKTSPIKNLELELLLSLEIDEKLGRRIESEVRVINRLPLVIKGQIVTEGTLIYSRDEILRVDFETLVRSAYFDFLPFLRMHQKAYVDNFVT